MRGEREAPERMARTAQILDRLKTLVSEESPLSVEHTSFVEDGESVLCNRPGCHQKGALPADAYYVSVGWDFTLCLRCFEMLWAGKFTEGLTTSDPFRRDSGVAFSMAQTDGPADYRPSPRRSARLKSNQTAPQDMAAEPSAPPPSQNDLFKSRWAIPEDEVQYLSPQRTPERQINAGAEEKTEANGEDANLDDSPSSITSDGEWIYPPTQIQHIAHLMQVGVTLSETDKAAVVLWQAASKSQLRWERHMWKTKATRAYYAGSAEEDEGLHAERLKLGDDIDEKELQELEAKAGMRKKDCNGRELSYVLKEAAKQKA